MGNPAQVLDLAGWKLTLPTGQVEHPTERESDVLQAGKEWPPYYEAGQDEDGTPYVAFRAPVDGVTTSGSGNPRSEYRQMLGVGKPAAWSATDSKVFNTLLIEEAFIAEPNKRTDSGIAGVVGAQIHDAKDDFCVLRREGANLWLTSGNNTHFKLLTNSYVAGTKVQLAFVAGNKKVAVYFNGNPVATLDASKLTGAYFKAGCYTQANSSNSKPNDETNYGEVHIYRLKVTTGSKAGDVAFPAGPTPPPVDTTPPPVDTPPVDTPPVDTPPVEVPVPAAKRTIIMLRHAEKDDNGDGKDDILHELSAKGDQRRVALTDAWTNGKTPAGLPKPDRYVASKGKSPSNRPLKSIQGIQVANNGPMNSTYDAEVDYKKLGPWLAQRLGVTMVCMEHSAIIDTFKLLGKISPSLPKAWDSKRFDLYWVFTSDDGKTWKFQQIPQMLMPGDKSSPIK